MVKTHSGYSMVNKNGNKAEERNQSDVVGAIQARDDGSQDGASGPGAVWIY